MGDPTKDETHESDEWQDVQMDYDIQDEPPTLGELGEEFGTQQQDFSNHQVERMIKTENVEESDADEQLEQENLSMQKNDTPTFNQVFQHG